MRRPLNGDRRRLASAKPTASSAGTATAVKMTTFRAAMANSGSARSRE